MKSEVDLVHAREIRMKLLIKERNQVQRIYTDVQNRTSKWNKHMDSFLTRLVVLDTQLKKSHLSPEAKCININLLRIN